MTTVTLELTTEETQIVINALMLRPFREVAGLIPKIAKQHDESREMQEKRQWVENGHANNQERDTSSPA